MRWIHIAAGLIAIASGAVALIAFKGGGLHRKSGMVFVYSMTVLTISAAFIAAFLRLNRGNVIAGLLTFYLVVTGLLSLRRAGPDRRRGDMIAMLGGLATALLSFGFGIYGMTVSHGMVDQYPAPAFFVFGMVGVLVAAQDRKMIAARDLPRAALLKRHLGRMSGAMLVATGSFFMGQPQVFVGTPLESVGLRVLPVVAVMAAMVYWRSRITVV
jgi:uncharacterized membrane protein